MLNLSRRSYIIIGFTLALIVLVNIVWWFYYTKTAESFEKQLDSRLSSLLALGSKSINPEMIGSLKLGYLSTLDSTLEVLENIKMSDSLSEAFLLDYNYKYLATTSLSNDSLYLLAALNRVFIDSTFSLTAYSESSKSIVGDGYPVGDLVLKSAFRPIFSNDGAPVAVLGIEADVDYADALFDLKQNLMLSSGVSIVAGLIFGLFFFMIQNRISKAERALLLNRSQANLGRMVAVVSHEIKNPLMIIRASAERLGKKFDNPREADFIIEETDRLNSILTGYLDFAGGKKKLDLHDVDLKSLIEKIAEQFKPRLSVDNIRLLVDDINLSKPIKADPVALRQIIINLLLNGADACRGVNLAEVKISLESDSSRARLSIVDNGRGLDKKTIENLFEPFFTTKTTGSGLGLYLSKELIGEMNGELSVESRIGGPTKFMISLPI